MRWLKPSNEECVSSHQLSVGFIIMLGGGGGGSGREF